MPSKTDPTDTKGDTSSWKFDTTQARSESHCTRIPSTGKPSLVSLESRLPKTYEDRVDDDSVLPDHTIVALCSHSSTSTHTSDTREWGSLKNETKVVMNRLPAKQRLQQKEKRSPMTLQPSSTTRAPAKTSTSSTTLQSTSAASYIFDSAHNLHRGRQISSLRSFAKAIPQPLARSSPSTTSPLTSITRASAKTLPPPTVSSRILVPAKMMFPTTASLSSSTGSPPSSTTLQPSPTALRFASRAPYINHSTPNPYQEPTIPLPCSIPLPHSFDKANPRPLALFPQRYDAPGNPFYPFHSIPLQGLKNDR